MKTRALRTTGQASIEYVLLFAGIALALAAGMAAFNWGLDAWWDEVAAGIAEPQL